MQIKKTGAAEYGRFIKSLIGGEPGAGKTLISSTWPNVFYASAEPGLMSVADRRVAYADVKSSADLSEIRQMLDVPQAQREKNFGQPIETIVIDTIDEVQKILVRERLRETKKESLVLQDWGWLGEQMQAIVRGFRNLDMHVVFLVHIKVERDEEAGRMYFKPGLQGAIADQMPAYVDLSLLLKSRQKSVIEGKETKRITERILQTQPDAQCGWIKDRSGKLPFEFEVNFKDDFARLHEAIFGGIESLPESFLLREDAIAAESEPIPEPQDIAPRGSQTPPPAPPVDERQAAAQQRKVHPAPTPAASPPSNVDPETGEIREETPSLAEDSPQVAKLEQMVAKVDSPDGLPNCESCGNAVESESQMNISKIRYRKVLCKPCFKTNK